MFYCAVRTVSLNKASIRFVFKGLMICAHYQFYSGDQRKRLADPVARMRERGGACSFLVGRPDGKRPLGKPRHRWDENIKTDLQEVRLGEWTRLIWLRIRTGDGLL